MLINKTLGPHTTAEVIVVGGGVIGLTIARALAQRGVREIMLIERGRPGAEASWAAGGILAPQVESDHPDEFFQLACASRDLYPEFADALKDETGVDVELDTTGTLCVGFDSNDEDELRRRYEWQQRAGLEVEFLTGDQVRRLEPCISAEVTCALRFPRDFQVENRRLIDALVRANEELGVQLLTGTSVSAIRIEQQSVCGVVASNGPFDAPIVVLAAGAWNSLIDAPGLPSIQIEPVRGQMLCFAASPQIARHVIYSSRGYLVPRRDGRVLAGSTAEQVGFDKSMTDEGVATIKSMAIEIAPGIAALPLIDSWAGFRPRAKDGLPVLGPSVQIEGLFYATGHYRNGILLAPITGKVIADAIVDGVMPASLDSFSPNRFGSV
ncbi:MAG: glycine oxidase [Blastocatellia bacterium]|jgi:glycine oxidase|nr:glycine oxidase [Blastocatellia bacterium]